jgi:hypothetical protein
MCSTLLTNLARIYRIPVGGAEPGPEARRKETRLPIVATSSGRLFLNGLLASIARLRFTGTRNLTCNFTKPRQKGTFLLCLDTEDIKLDVEYSIELEFQRGLDRNNPLPPGGSDHHNCKSVV